MKNKFFRNLFKFSAIALAAVVLLGSCKKDDDEPSGPDGPVILDGIYIKGAGTALTELSTTGKMAVTKNEVGQAERSTLLEYYVAVEAGTDGFQIVKVEGGVETAYGPGADFAVVDTADEGRITDEPRKPYDFSRGSLAEGTTFTVDESGLYHVVYDTELEVAIVAEAAWGIIGAAIGSWSESTQMEATFDKNKMTFSVQDTVFEASEYKFRYGNGWKIVLEPEVVRVNTNLGGGLTALEAGGDNIVSGDYAIYDIELVWELGKPYTASMTYVKDGPPLASYPEAMYITGDATAYGWAEPATDDQAIMHKIAGGDVNDGIYWKICHLEASTGFKLSAAGWADPNLDHGLVDEWDAEGVTVTASGNDWTVAESGMYMVVLNLQEDMVKVSIKPAEVYGIGDAFGGWDAGVAANKFTVDNTAKTITSPAVLAADGHRMYASHAWITEWWHAEFIVNNDVIEYRNNGGDPAAVAVTADQVITLNFDANTGTIQ